MQARFKGDAHRGHASFQIGQAEVVKPGLADQGSDRKRHHHQQQAENRSSNQRHDSDQGLDAFDETIHTGPLLSLDERCAGGW